MSENAEAEKPAEPDADAAPAGASVVVWEVVGADGRRVERWLPEAEARAFASQLSAVTGEKLKAQRQKL